MVSQSWLANALETGTLPASGSAPTFDENVATTTADGESLVVGGTQDSQEHGGGTQERELVQDALQAMALDQVRMRINEPFRAQLINECNAVNRPPEDCAKANGKLDC